MKTCELFETPPFLEKRLGTEVFDDVPKSPGIYRFYDEDDLLLYVGKAKNLRRRLFTYKRAKPGKTSRKESKLISRINRIEFDLFESEKEAILQENRWIRKYRPEFNHANKYTETYYFITVQRSETSFIFGLSMNPSGQLLPEKDKPLYHKFPHSFNNHICSKTYGCFKGHRTVRISLGSLLQLIWMDQFGSLSPHFLPVQLSRNLTPMRFQLPMQHQNETELESLEIMLDNWLLGNSTNLLDHLKEKVQRRSMTTFTKNFVDENIEILEIYFQKTLLRYRIMRELKKNKESHLIEQGELDDLMTRCNSNQQQTKDN
ncbi:MAG: nucleotide excision repair endonuclease [Balneolaceae bacterium]|nr:nucleotide excision repair endonuclease [Balneolaceae bacterium]